MLFRPIRNRKLDNWHLKTSTSRLWIRYNDERVSLPENILELLRVFNVGDLKAQLKTQLKIKGDIAIRSGSDSLEESKLVTELFNTEDNAYEITVEGNDNEGEEKEYGSNIENIETNRIEDAFQIGYQGTVLETFYSRLKQFHNEWHKQIKPYAPYLTIIQNSGSGKTRLVGELRTKGVYVLYICKRQQNSSGYPASTPYVQQIFEKIRDYKFGLLLSEGVKLIKNNNWSEEQFWNLQIKAEHENIRTQFWKNVLESVESLSQQSNLLSNKNFIKSLFDKNEAEILVVCCIDEAHELLGKISTTSEETFFVRWRRQIRNIMWNGFFNILLSTNGKIGNFLPPEIRDTRSARTHQYYLFPAYLDVHTIDALARLAPSGNSYNHQRTLYLGIPLWGSLAQAGVDLTNVLHLASQKIRNFSNKQKDHLANLACMSCSFALEISPRIAEVEMLIASHMATAIGVSPDRTELLCTYPSDPILASGALKGIVEVGFEDCLDTLLEQFSRGVVEAGERGELVSRILFLEAYIRAVEISQESPITYLEKVPLPLFLKTLCKGMDEKLVNLLIKMGLDQAEIGFNHWTSLLASNKSYVRKGGQKHLSEVLVKEAYHRHTAIKMPILFPVIDHVIPFKYPQGYGIISIQNKNAKTTKYKDSDVPILVNPVSAFADNNFDGIILGIYIDIGAGNFPKIMIKEIDSIKRRNRPAVSNKAIYIQHINSFNCKKEIRERLSKVLFTSPWPLDTRWSMINEENPLDREKAIKSFLPLVFKQERSLANDWHL
ncbi:hypothetical protein RhiirC2_796312 [Rhizophagus irregularis]|uniref:Crinkler family protein n=1 Tax=Rhizophagus irregularis TaxID=588596 RepID=A0A2N1M9W9_9GLOM|nr:hypothetical protein RhiirC2_796312 [Rhizophagus irregularis]